jgi:hypothetical protein
MLRLSKGTTSAPYVFTIASDHQVSRASVFPANMLRPGFACWLLLPFLI